MSNDMVGQNGWTGRAYSLYRLMLGFFVLFLAFSLGRGDLEANLLERSFFTIPIPAAIFFVVFNSKVAAAVLAFYLIIPWFPDAGSRGFPPYGTHLTALVGPLVLGLLFSIHIAIPGRPFGAWFISKRAGSRRPLEASLLSDEADPRAGWRIPPRIFSFAWGAAVCLHGFAGLLELSELSEAATVHMTIPKGLALESVQRWPEVRYALAALKVCAPIVYFLCGRHSLHVRHRLWGALVAVTLASIMVDGLALTPPGTFDAREIAAIWLIHGQLTVRMALLFALGLIFDPAWIRPKDDDKKILVFYDGACGVCHFFVRFCIAEDRRREPLRYAPLGGESFRCRIPAETIKVLPSSVVVLGPSGKALVRTRAVRSLLASLGGIWRVVGWGTAAIPTPLFDLFYRFVAVNRRWLARKPKEACPLLSPELRNRFEP